MEAARPSRTLGRMPDIDLGDGSIKRTDPITGKSRIISQADYARTKLDKERNNEFAMQTGAPAIAKGPTTQPAPAPKPAAAVAPAAPAQPAATAPTVPNATPPPPAVKPGDPLPTAQQAQAAAPRLPDPASLQNMQMAAGPNISTDPNGLPAGSIGYQRGDGTYVVETRDSQKRTFANEQMARDNFKQIAARPQAAQAAESFLNRPRQAVPSAPVIPAAAQALAAAPASGTPSPTGTVRNAMEGLPATPGAAASPQFAQMQAEAVPVAPVTPNVAPQLEGIMAAATAAPAPAPTPTNSLLRPPGTEVRPVNQSAVSRDLGRLTEATGTTKRNAESRRRSEERSRAEEDAQMKQRIKSPGIQREIQNNRIDSPATPPRLPTFDDEEPTAFPTLPGSAGSSRPRAILA